MTFNAYINAMVPLNLLFPLQRVICPQSCQSEKYQFDNVLLINVLMTILSNGKNLAYQSLVNIPTPQLHSPLLPAPEETPVPATRTFLSCDLLTTVPALSSQDISIRMSRPDPIKTFCAQSTDAAKRRSNLGGLPSLGPHQDYGRAKPREYYAPTERA